MRCSLVALVNNHTVKKETKREQEPRQGKKTKAEKEETRIKQKKKGSGETW